MNSATPAPAEAPAPAKVEAPASAQASDASGKTSHIKITLVEPLHRDTGPITHLTLRKPKAGEMRGLTVEALFTSDINAVLTLLPRISDPFITDPEAAALSTEDLGEIAGTVKGFFMTPAMKAQVAAMFGGEQSKN